MIDPPVRHVEVGILSGSGPEAGHDLLGRVIALTREQLGAEFHGDVDALSVRLVSLPRLGLSMGLPGTDDDVWPELLAADTARPEETASGRVTRWCAASWRPRRLA
jgi:hypothetical protein